jgi:hypothetical protein
MAEVFEAVMSGAHGFTRRVAIKRISTRAADDPELAERFLDEARIASQLHHAGIVGVLDYGFVDGLPFQVLEFVDGLDADRLIDRAGGALPADIALIIAADVAHALDHAHRACDANGIRLGIVHRDVKPANVLVSWDGDVKLSDFGIALARGRIAVTEAGVARGTPVFMAPEQRTRSETGPRTDVFALGCTLHALLTGTSPLVDLEVAMRVISGEPAPIADSIPADLREVIARAVAPAPEARFADCGAFADALGRLVAHRLDRDARGRLRDFLTALRRPAPAGGLLDQLLAVDLVMLAADGHDEVVEASTRSFTLVTPSSQGDDPPAEPPAQDLLPVIAPAPAPVIDDEPPRAPARRRAVWIIGLLILAAGTGVGIRMAMTTDGVAPSVDAPRLVILTRDAPTAPPPDAPTPGPVPAVDARAATPDARDRSRRPDAARTARVDAAASSSAVGVVSISAAGGLARAKIFVDGKFAEYVPNPVTVPVGRHRLEVEKEDGTRLGPVTIDVTPYHTPSKPLRPRL